MSLYYTSLNKSFWQVAEMLDRLYACDLVKELQDRIDQAQEQSRECDLSGPDFAPFSRIPKSATIEELLAFTELEQENSPWRKYQKPLRDLVFVLLEEILRPQLTARDTCYDRFVADCVDRGKRNTFLSFNYDVFLDRALWHATLPLPSDYCLTVPPPDHWPQYCEMLKGSGYLKEADLLTCLLHE